MKILTLVLLAGYATVSYAQNQACDARELGRAVVRKAYREGSSENMAMLARIHAVCEKLEGREKNSCSDSAANYWGYLAQGTYNQYQERFLSSPCDQTVVELETK